MGGDFVLAIYVHDIDPIILTVGGVHVWWYGLGYTLGFWQLHRFVQRHRASLGLDARDAFTLSLFVIVGVLLGGRVVGRSSSTSGPSTAITSASCRATGWAAWPRTGCSSARRRGAALFSVLYRRSFLRLADVLVIPGAFLMGMGRLGNFIDGQIVGGVTDVWWGVKFPYADGVRHPVVLYDGLKNLLLVPYLLRVRATNPTPGATAARFVFWYAFLRIFIDLFRDYPTHRLALGTGQTLNLVMAALGVLLLVRSRLRRLGRLTHSIVPADATPREPRPPLRWQQGLLAALLLFCLTIASSWTQNVPRQYESRHPGLRHSWLYPDIDTAPPAPVSLPPTQR